jgi:hypothetical protein
MPSRKSPTQTDKHAGRKFTLKPDVPVHCACDDFIPLDQFIPNPKNPNTHPQVQIDLLGTIISTTGWRLSVTVSKLSGMVTKGHGRLMAARAKGLRGAPVDYQHYSSPEEEWADVIADNAIAELSHLDLGKTKEIIEQLQSKKFDLQLTGLTSAKLGEMFKSKETEDPQYKIAAMLDENYDYVVIFTDNNTDSIFLRQLVGVGKEKEKSYKNDSVGYGRGVKFKDFMTSLRANIASITGGAKKK